jgi:hypothetical protein
MKQTMLARRKGAVLSSIYVSGRSRSASIIHSTRSSDLIEAAHGRPFMLRHVHGGDKLSLLASMEGQLPMSLALVMDVVLG